MSTSRRGWEKILLEGFVIVASILLAFGIDAAWDLRQDREHQQQLLGAMLDEFNSNRDELERRRTQGAAARAAQLGLIDLIGPRTEAVSVDSLSALIRTSASFGTAELESDALDAVLTGTSAQTASRTQLFRLLRAYRTELEDHRSEDRRQWIDLRMELARYLGTVSPYAFVWAPEFHGATDFEVPVEVLLRDPQLESMVSRLAVRSLQMVRTVEALTVLADSIVSLAAMEMR